jgi:hypothetical protein
MPLLAMPQKQKERRQMIEQALKDKAPKTYRELNQAGKLKEFVANQEEQMMESYQRAWSEVTTETAMSKVSNPMERLQAQTMGESRVWEETLATFLEFADPEPEMTM